MAGEVKVEIDDREIKEFLQKVGSRDALKKYRSGIKAAARILRNDTIRRFRSMYNYNNPLQQKITRTPRRKINTLKEITKNRQIAKVTSKIKSDVVTVKVHIMDDYRVKWLEMGTQGRYTKGRKNIGYYRLRPDSRRKYVLRVGKPQWRGRITPGKFFAAAKRSKEQDVKKDIWKRISKIIRKNTNT